MLNGVLAGAVAITANCAVVESYAAFIIGFVAAFIYTGASKLLLRWGCDRKQVLQSRLSTPLSAASQAWWLAGHVGLPCSQLCCPDPSPDAVCSHAAQAAN